MRDVCSNVTGLLQAKCYVVTLYSHAGGGFAEGGGLEGGAAPAGKVKG